MEKRMGFSPCQKLISFDLTTTGLDPKKGSRMVCEVAAIIIHRYEIIETQG
jgi:hypothetical protein